MDTLVIGYKFPTIRALYGLAPIRLCPCWGNWKNPGKSKNFRGFWPLPSNVAQYLIIKMGGRNLRLFLSVTLKKFIVWGSFSHNCIPTEIRLILHKKSRIIRKNKSNNERGAIAPMTEAELLKLIQGGENILVEFKKSTTEITKDVYDTVCSFSNRNGGIILLGVKDNGEILGVAPDAVDRMKKDFVTSINNG